MSAGPADTDDLDDFLGRVPPDGIPQDSVESLGGMMARMKVDVVERGGATDFEYKPLPPGYFRLLTIRDLGDSPIVKMEAFPMDGAPKYAAVSYARGRDVSSRAFLCNDRNFAVSGYVLDALNHIGLAWQDSKIWIDAICINQADDTEKALQVAEMRRIYYKAEKVVVWLGAAEDESDLVLQNMEAFLEWNLSVRSTGFTPGQVGWRLLNPPPDSLFFALGRFLTRPWFHRVWVVQEMLLAKEAVLLCGNRFVNWNVFCGAVLLMSENGMAHLMANMDGVPSPLVSVAIANLGELHRLFEKGREGLCTTDFIKLLKMGRFRKVTEPVDRVYGFLGLADEGLRAAAAALINYSPERRHEYWRAYADIGKLILQRDPDLLLLSTVPSRNRSPLMPSWCPDFHAAGLSGTSIQEARNGNWNFHSGYAQGSEGKPIVEFGPNPYTLKLKGFPLDKVDKVITVNFRPFSCWEDERIQNATQENLALWDRQCLALARATIKQGPAKMHFLDVHWRTLSFDQMADQPKQVVRQAYLTFRDWANQTQVPARLPSNLTAEAGLMVRRFIDKIGFSCSRAYFSTVRGRLGLGPRNMAVGDLVYIVHDAKVPYILRSRPTKTEMRFIGDCYVDGVMYGESMEEGRTSEVFSID